MSIPEMTLTMAEISDLDLSETVLAIANLQAEIERLRGVEERWQYVVDGGRRGSFGEWVIFPDEPHDRQDIKEQFVRDVDAAIAASRSTGAADVGEDHG